MAIYPSNPSRAYQRHKAVIFMWACVTVLIRFRTSAEVSRGTPHNAGQELQAIPSVPSRLYRSNFLVHRTIIRQRETHWEPLQDTNRGILCRLIGRHPGVLGGVSRGSSAIRLTGLTVSLSIQTVSHWRCFLLALFACFGLVFVYEFATTAP